MNIVFWMLVVITVVVAWFCLSSLFQGIGEFLLELFEDAKSKIFEKESGRNEKNEKR